MSAFTQLFVATMLLLAIAVTTTSAYPYYGPGQNVYYPQQQMRPFYQSYRPSPYNAYQQQQQFYHSSSPYIRNKYALRRSTVEQGLQDGAGAYNHADEPFVLGEGEIAVGPSSNAPNPYADESLYHQQDVPSFQGDPELNQHHNNQEFDDQPEALADAQAIHQGGNSPAVKQQHHETVSAPAQTFFPMHFLGSTSDGTIAVANSYSTGKGSAASHAVAYGNNALAANAARKHV